VPALCVWLGLRTWTSGLARAAIRRGKWQLAFVLAAFVSGEDYVMSLRESALSYMSIGWAGAVIAYGTGWYLGHGRERREEAAPLPGR
jgi:hypothetical protein